MSKKFEFPPWLKGTEEQKRAEAERQVLAMASHSRAKLTPAERLVGRGKLLEETARQNLADARRRDKEARIVAQNQLADALAMQGQFAEAAKLHTDRYRRKYFRDVVKAIQKSDEEKCNCTDLKAKAGGRELAITPRFERATIFSPVHGETVSLVECSRCGHLNARPLRSRLLKHQSALNESEQMKRPVISDATLLNAAAQ